MGKPEKKDNLPQSWYLVYEPEAWLQCPSSCPWADLPPCLSVSPSSSITTPDSGSLRKSHALTSSSGPKVNSGCTSSVTNLSWEWAQGLLLSPFYTLGSRTLNLLCKILGLRDVRAEVSAYQRLFFWKGGTYLDVNKVRQRNHLFYLEDKNIIAI